ncbi:helix-turn-helix transcriptional regulator [Tamlana sp. s12]|uniref:helix-turn-helix domain-containing protein n=1 Tax=Tamlana sp. s12 TaxID=1630406 RepID=UPI0007FC050B|nr:helix-turn-helix transcriptional regulator [Tamlana sp. s12]OBQ52895.1 hypothetical protein VQ01_13180 [Tamlana sp. s12]QQY81078.1 helix-turn-helix transcriptional regulator [Tamlana sp. s12]
MNFISRIKAYLEEKNTKPATAERLSGLSNGTLSKAISTNKNISVDTLEKFLTVYNDINLNWLFYEEGKMLKEVNTIPDNIEDAKNLERKIFELEIRLDECRRKSDDELLKKGKELI